MMQMHYFHEISRQVASNHRASEKAHSRKLGSMNRPGLLETPVRCGKGPGGGGWEGEAMCSTGLWS